MIEVMKNKHLTDFWFHAGGAVYSLAVLFFVGVGAEQAALWLSIFACGAAFLMGLAAVWEAYKKRRWPELYRDPAVLRLLRDAEDDNQPTAGEDDAVDGS
jgi:predicted membrane channel-forming protein YqfA (hemolysin III family)